MLKTPSIMGVVGKQTRQPHQANDVSALIAGPA